MATSLTGVTVDTGVPAQNVRAPSNPVISTAGNDTQAIARQQLPSAVPAPALLAAYSTGIAQQPKPPAKAFSSAPSSTFATQFLAQDAGEEGDLALFELPVQAQAQEEPVANDYLNDLRVARGDIPAAQKAAATPASVATEAQEATQAAKSTATAISETGIRSGIAQSAAAVPNLFSQLIRRPNIVQAKGVSAYQLAEARNATNRKALASNTLVAELAN